MLAVRDCLQKRLKKTVRFLRISSSKKHLLASFSDEIAQNALESTGAFLKTCRHAKDIPVTTKPINNKTFSICHFDTNNI